VLDLEAYLARIGLHGRPGVASVHRAHSTTIPFENLDPRHGLPVSLATADIERKLVDERRGGYCFEHNLLLKAALEQLGAEVDIFLARVRYGAPPGVVRPRGHLVLRVRTGGEELHADVGFGLGTLFEPLPWGPGAVHQQSGWRYRVVEDGGELVLQVADGKRWLDLYGFAPQPVPLIDVETVNWWVCTNPHSPFVSGLMVTLQDDDGTRTVLSDREGLCLSVSTPSRTSVEPLTREQLPELLASRFGIEGFGLDGDGRLVPAEAADAPTR
jgi:N-hydroxyarylamine O-acetyltransferase